MNYRIRWDFNKSQPKWTYRLAHDFGPNNEGAIVAGENPTDAVDNFNNRRLRGAQYNPFYLEVKSA